MKERPIIFNGEMVREILEGRKTMTRRLAKVTDKGCRPGMITPTGYYVPRTPKEHTAYCPYGQPGDRLWVRETHHVLDAGYIDGKGREIVYRADEPDWPYGWTPSIHMPRFASRITLEITDVRVERVQDISEADADAEAFGGDSPAKVLPGLFPGNADDWSHLSIPECFAVLWDSINGKKPGRSWADNPWVWVISFKRIGG